jgi:hypothetical protein
LAVFMVQARFEVFAYCDILSSLSAVIWGSRASKELPVEHSEMCPV